MHAAFFSYGLIMLGNLDLDDLKRKRTQMTAKLKGKATKD